MTQLDAIREKIKKLHRESPIIHLSASISRPRLSLSNAEVEITGVYPHVFIVKEINSPGRNLHTVQYTDVLIKHIVISELEKEG